MAVGTWAAHAKCRGMDPSDFHPYRGGVALLPKAPVLDESAFELVTEEVSYELEATTIEDTVCAGCPVRLPCLDHAMGEMHGIWGGWRAEIRSWVRRTARPCVWCSWPIPQHAQRLFCGWECLTAAVGAEGEEKERVDKVLADLEETARLRIATSKGRRQTEGLLDAP